MTQQANILALIPARGGSKGLIGKNLYPILDKPLLQYTIDEAQKSRHITQLMMSSEDAEINRYAESLGVKVDYVRPASLAEDHTTTAEAVLHALDWLEERNELPDAIILLQPTSPLRTVEEMDDAIEQFLASDKQSLVSVQPMKEHPFKCIQQQDGEWQYLAKPEKFVSRRQDYTNDYYVINGAIYIVTPQWLREKGEFTGERESELFVMDCISGVDIDDLTDVFQVEALLKMRQMQLK
ncbi:cytidylyltransferase domain-containing protein [Hydrogenovibrio sp. JE_KL2]|uniref:acylneuraminate cytidylyltransferase family protein n=1 Tax=Hydrogenovibrio sp. JE_KL2 TaxID=2651188 RepID=UPI00128C5674|nr:acylneuraminate cytidylyltransferase family protein [Hydrogenovibrio sp. JE_KL2]MPQ76944.1 acylneuraminate cytidylyltransferase family protein [Hydrogenovibrio sp. JE_KL2]